SFARGAAQLLEACQRRRLVAGREHLLAKQPIVAGRGEYHDVVFHRAPARVGCRVAAPAKANREVPVVPGELLEPDLDVRCDVRPGAHQVDGRCDSALRIPAERPAVYELVVRGIALRECVPIARVPETGGASSKALGLGLRADLLEAPQRGVGVVTFE